VVQDVTCNGEDKYIIKVISVKVQHLYEEVKDTVMFRDSRMKILKIPINLKVRSLPPRVTLTDVFDVFSTMMHLHHNNLVIPRVLRSASSLTTSYTQPSISTMKAHAAALSLCLGLTSITAFAPAGNTRSLSRFAPTRSASLAPLFSDKVFDQEAFIAESKEMRLKHLEEQAMFALKIAVENYGNAVFPNALIAGDVVITHLLHRMGYLQSGRAKVMVVDTFHLFPETMDFLRQIEQHYGFTAEVFCAEGVPVGDKQAYDKKYGADLWKEDIEQYDKVCKVEPFQRGLKTLKTDCMINGRTKWQGFERAWIDQVR
jgi:hypothetical protein